ncbi:gamma-tubulin complex component 3 [Pancytospora epiphaga]|nr:gamma-tubulin complex component 3 [Pancytospora epiphaga]
MKKLLEKFVSGLLHPAIPSPLFLESLTKYTKQAPVNLRPIDTPLGARSSRALFLYRTLPPDSTARLAVYVLLCLSEYSPTVEEELRLSLHRIALGFPVAHITNLPLLKRSISNQVYQVLQRIYEGSLRYTKIVLESGTPRSQTHGVFLNSCLPVIREYERAVVASELDFLKFHSRMYPFYCKLKEMCHINDLITDKEYKVNRDSAAIAKGNDDFTENPQNRSISNGVVVSPFTEYKMVGCFHLNIFNELLKYNDIAYCVYNSCTKSYFLTGTFYDPHGEYFVKEHLLDYGKIPPILSQDSAEKIVYIGKHICFLKHFEHSLEMKELINSIDISTRSFDSKIHFLLKYTNGLLMSDFIKKYKIAEFFEFIKSVFLFGRGDFVEHLFISLKSLRKSSRRHILSALETALRDAFPESPFVSTVDIFVKNEQETTDGLADSFGLYCKVDYPISILIEEEFILKLVYVFKFLWKLKRVDHLSRRVSQAKYVNFVNRLMFYVFNEALSSFSASKILGDWKDDSLALDILRNNLNRRLDNAVKKLFINTGEKRMEYLLFYMEKAFVSAGKTGIFEETEIQNALNAFIESTSVMLKDTSLSNIEEFL